MFKDMKAIFNKAKSMDQESTLIYKQIMNIRECLKMI